MPPCILKNYIDWLPTLLHAAGYDTHLLNDKQFDGLDLWDSLSTNAQNSPRTEFIYNINPQKDSYAIRIGDMKLIYGKEEAGKFGGWIRPNKGRARLNQTRRSDISLDLLKSALFEFSLKFKMLSFCLWIYIFFSLYSK